MFSGWKYILIVKNIMQITNRIIKILTMTYFSFENIFSQTI